MVPLKKQLDDNRKHHSSESETFSAAQHCNSHHRLIAAGLLHTIRPSLTFSVYYTSTSAKLEAYILLSRRMKSSEE